MKKVIIALASATVLFACEKKKNDDGSDNVPVTRFVLMGDYGKAWDQSEGSMTYYSASGSVDSTVTLPADLTTVMWFGDNGGVNGLNTVFYADAPFSRMLPAGGAWQLDEAQQILTLNCIAQYCNGDKNASWKVLIYKGRDPNFGERITFTSTQQLPNSRKVEKRFVIYRL